VIRPALLPWLPNLITLARLLSVPVMVYLIFNDLLTAAFWLFLMAGLSDALDGFIAKQFNVATRLGAYLDPLADKALLVSVYVSLGVVDHLPVWVVILVVFRDALIIGGAILYEQLTHRLRMQPLLVSKLNTTVQIMLAVLILARLGLDLDSGWLEGIMIWAVAVTTFLSGGAYVITWGRRALQEEQQE
jgi:cardiolipin synthase